MLIFMESGSHYSPTLGVKLGKCNQAEMYGEHMEFDSLHSIISLVIWQAWKEIRCLIGIFVVLADSHSVCDCFVPCNPTLLLPTSMCAKGIGYLENKKLSKIESNYS